MDKIAEIAGAVARRTLAFLAPLSVAMTSLYWLVSHLNEGKPALALIGFGLSIFGSFAADSFFRQHLAVRKHLNGE